MKKTIINLALLLVGIFLSINVFSQSVWVTSDNLIQSKSTEEFNFFNEQFNLKKTKNKKQ